MALHGTKDAVSIVGASGNSFEGGYGGQSGSDATLPIPLEGYHTLRLSHCRPTCAWKKEGQGEHRRHTFLQPLMRVRDDGQYAVIHPVAARSRPHLQQQEGDGRKE